MLTGEYFVLDGAPALAVPTRYGQGMKVQEQPEPAGELSWESFDEKGTCWFSGIFDLASGNYKSGTDAAVGKALTALLQSAKQQGTNVLDRASYHVSTHLEFPRDWGLGSSSTLIVNLARWLAVDPFQLLQDTFGGSGYDLACALAGQPILYRLTAAGPVYDTIDFKPDFHPQLYFVYLGQKQNSREGIRRYRELITYRPQHMDRISTLSQAALMASELMEFQAIMREHEAIIGEALQLTPVQQRLFPDFPGTIKSLGAWGGDFVLVATELPEKEVKQYFQDRGYPTIFRYAALSIS